MGQEKYWLQERGPLPLWRWRTGVLQGPAQVIVANQQVPAALLRYSCTQGTPCFAQRWTLRQNPWCDRIAQMEPLPHLKAAQ